MGERFDNGRQEMTKLLAGQDAGVPMVLAGPGARPGPRAGRSTKRRTLRRSAHPSAALLALVAWTTPASAKPTTTALGSPPTATAAPAASLGTTAAPAASPGPLPRVQDTVAVVEMEGVRVEVPRPTTTTGGTSAVEVSVDSAGVLAAPTMEDFLRRMPLIQIRANSRGEAQPALRGAEDRQIAVLLDGIPLTLGWDHRTDLSVIPMTAVRQMTLLRGLSSMVHGPNVLGGALEFDVARGTSHRAPPTWTGALSVAPSGGRNATAAAGTLLERDYSSWVVRGGASYRNRPGVPVPEDAFLDPALRPEFLAGNRGSAQRLNSDRRQLDGFVSAHYLRSGGAWASGLASLSDVTRGVPPEAHVSDPRLWRYPNQSRFFAALSGGSGERPTRWGRGDLEASFGVDRSVSEIDEYATAGYETVVNGETGVTTTLTGRLLADHEFPNAIEVRSALTVADVAHKERFLAGDQFGYEQRLWSLGAEVEMNPARLLGRGGGDPDADRAGGGRGALSDGNGGLRVSVGGALDGADTPLSGDKPPLGVMWDWGLRAGATFAAHGGNVRYHAGVSRRTRFPSLRELYSGALGRFEPNPGLHPEQLVAAEAGVTFDVEEAHLQLVGFHHHLYEGIVRGRVVTPEGTRFQRINRDEILSTGVEFLAAGSWGRLTYGGDLTLQRVVVRDAGAPGRDHRAEYEPTAAGNLNLTIEGPSRVAFTGFLHLRGSQFCENVESPALGQLDASATLDLEARRMFRWGAGSFRRRVEGTIGLSNATDSKVLDQCGLPQPGRMFRVQINLR